MRRIIIITISVLFLCLSASAQKQDDFKTIDSNITLYYTAGAWDSVIYFGNTGLASNIDYFYLRKHLGEAYFYKKNYLSAAHHFENAMKKNSYDVATQEFLYYSYLYSGRESDVRALQPYISTETLKEIKAKSNYRIDNIYLESGISPSNNFSKNQNQDFSGGKHIFGGAVMSGKSSYTSLGLKAWLGNKVSVYAAFSFANEQKKNIFDATIFKPAGREIKETDTVVTKPFPPPPYTTNDTIIRNIQRFRNEPLINKNDIALHQKEIYLNGSIHLAKGLDITPFVHLLATQLTMITPAYSLTDYTATNHFDTLTQFHYPPPPVGTGEIRDTVFHWDTTYTVKTSNYSFHTKDTLFVNYSVGIAISKNIGNFAISLTGSYSNLNGRKQKEIGASATWFPLGNLNLYCGAELTGYEEDNTKLLVKKFLAGGKIWKKIWLEGTITLGDMSSYTEMAGYIVNNNPDIVKYRIGITPMIFFKKFDIILHYQYQEKQGSYFYDNGTNPMTEGTFKYQNQLITGGIKWKL